MSTTVRIDEQTRSRLLDVAAKDYGGVTADQAVTRLLDEHWQRMAIEGMDRFREEDPEGWAAYLLEADRMDRASGLPVEP